MDVIDLRVIITVVSFIAFLGIVFWAYNSRRQSGFDEAALLPFADDAMQERTLGVEAGDTPLSTDRSAKGQSANTKSEVSNG